MNIKEALPSQDSATGRGIKTTAQAGIATVILAALLNLVVSVWNVPGVPPVVFAWIQSNIAQITASIGLSSGFVALIWNLFRKNVERY